MAREVVMLTGDWSALEAKLKEMPNNMAKNGSFRAMRRAGKIMADEQRQRAPDGGPGEGLKESIRLTARSKNLTGLAEYASAMQSGGSYKDAQQALRAARRGGGSAGTRILLTIGATAPHAHLVEFGTVERFHESGKSTGVMPMNPFIRPAWDAKAQTCLQAIRIELEAEIRRLEGKGPKIKASEAGLIDG